MNGFDQAIEQLLNMQLHMDVLGEHRVSADPTVIKAQLAMAVELLQLWESEGVGEPEEQDD